MKIQFFEILKKIKLRKSYFVFALLYGLTTLIIPLAVQYLVNNLILAGILQNTITFILIISFGLISSVILRYYLIIISEYIEREIFIMNVPEWNLYQTKEPHYFLELFNGMKSFSKTFADFVDITLTLTFGILTIILFHPGFIILPLVIISGLYLIWHRNSPAIATSIKESDQKYNLLGSLPNDKEMVTTELYLIERHDHFRFIKINTIIVGVLFFVSQILLLGLGIYFVESDSLSVGQLVSAEIIVSGIFATLLKFPKTMEAFYDFETSNYKLKKALNNYEKIST